MIYKGYFKYTNASKKLEDNRTLSAYGDTHEEAVSRLKEEAKRLSDAYITVYAGDVHSCSLEIVTEEVTLI